MRKEHVKSNGGGYCELGTKRLQQVLLKYVTVDLKRGESESVRLILPRSLPLTSSAVREREKLNLRTSGTARVTFLSDLYLR